jgi:membrane-associated protein
VSVDAEALLSLLAEHPYLLLFPLVMVEGPLTTICAGLLVSMGLLDWSFAYAVVVMADLTADSLYYMLGRSARHSKTDRWLPRLGLSDERLARIEESFRRNDARALVGAKIADFAAVPVFVVAGLTKMSYARFLALNLAATLLKSGVLLTVGFFAGQQALRFARYLDPSAAAYLAFISLALVTYLVISKKKKASNRGAGTFNTKIGESDEDTGR